MKQGIRTALCAAIAASGAASAQEGRMAEVVVTAARMEQSLADALPSTTVITRERIEASQASDIATLLRREAGVEITQTGGIGAQASIFMRGSNSTHTLVLIDGMRMQSLTTGTTSIEHLLPGQIERIEVVRGNVSSLYGSQAMGGVIQIFTRQGRGAPAATAEVQAGSRDTRSIAAGFSGEVDATRFALNASGFSTGGFSSINPQTKAATLTTVNPDRDGYRNQALSGNLTRTLGQSHEVGLRYYRVEGYANFDSAFATPTTTHYSDYFGESLAAYWRAQLLPRWRSTLTYARGKDYLKSYTNGVAAAPVSSINQQWTWQNQVRIADGHRLDLTVESQAIGLDSTTAYARKARSIDSLVAGYNGAFGIFDAQLNWRSDRFSDFGAKGTYFAGLGARIADDWKIIVSSSTAFKAPTFNEMFFPGGANPNLKPEQARSAEGAVQWSRGSHLARLTYYDTRYTDLITGFPSVNVAKAKVNGFELTYSGQLAGYDLRLGATVQDPRDMTTGLLLQRRAKRYGSVGVGRTVGAWSFGLDWRGSAERRDTDITTAASLMLPAYRVFDATVRYAIDKSWSLGARLENVADQQYSLVHGYNTPRRGVFVTLAYRPR